MFLRNVRLHGVANQKTSPCRAIAVATPNLTSEGMLRKCMSRIRCSSVGIVTGLWTGRPRNPVSISDRERYFFLLRLRPGRFWGHPDLCEVGRGPGGLSPGVEQPGHEAIHSTPSNAAVDA
jgi:hypothetical protein